MSLICLLLKEKYLNLYLLGTKNLILNDGQTKFSGGSNRQTFFLLFILWTKIVEEEFGKISSGDSNFENTYEGFFGKGIYFTNSVRYASDIYSRGYIF